LNTQESDAVASDLSCEPAASNDRHGCAGWTQADGPAEKGNQVGGTGRSDLKCALILEEELALFREEQTEPREFQLLGARFDLGKIRSVRRRRWRPEH
jgi:hypothetical protein